MKSDRWFFNSVNGLSSALYVYLLCYFFKQTVWAGKLTGVLQTQKNVMSAGANDDKQNHQGQ